MTDPIEVVGGRRRRRGNGASTDNSACSAADCDLPCDGCDLPCDFFRISLLAGLALTTPRRAARRGPTPAARLGVAAIHGYRRWLSPRLNTACRHTPTCSRYGEEAVRRYGLLTGSRLAVGRISRCNHATPHGTVDPVP